MVVGRVFQDEVVGFRWHDGVVVHEGQLIIELADDGHFFSLFPQRLQARQYIQCVGVAAHAVAQLAVDLPLAGHLAEHVAALFHHVAQPVGEVAVDEVFLGVPVVQVCTGLQE